jgi:hypothetical protein
MRFVCVCMCVLADTRIGILDVEEKDGRLLSQNGVGGKAGRGRGEGERREARV